MSLLNISLIIRPAKESRREVGKSSPFLYNVFFYYTFTLCELLLFFFPVNHLHFVPSTVEYQYFNICGFPYLNNICEKYFLKKQQNTSEGILNLYLME